MKNTFHVIENKHESLFVASSAMMRNRLKFGLHLIVVLMFSPAMAGVYDDLFIAVIRDDPRALKRLFAQGVDPNTCDEKGMPALMVAIRRESPQAFQALLAHPQTDPDAANASDETALMLTAISGDVEASLALLARGARVQRPGWTPLHYAASGPSTALTKLLLERGAQVDAAAPNGTTPLMLAAQHAPEATVDLLLKNGADTRRTNRRGLRAIDFAEGGGRDFIVERLSKLPH